MDGASVKTLRPGKPTDVRPAELDPSEFLAAAVRADQARPSRAEANSRRSGFETSISTGRYAYVAVQALDGSKHLLGQSATATAPAAKK